MIDGPATATLDGGTIENPMQPDAYGRRFDGSVIREPAVSNPDSYPALDFILTLPDCIVQHDNVPSVGSFAGQLSYPYRTPRFEDIKYHNGSFAKEICEPVWKHYTTQRKTFVETLPLQTTTPTAYTRRFDHSAPRTDLTCISPWNSYNGRRTCGTLINPTHTVHAWHSGYTPPIGTTIHFVTMQNEIITREVIDRTRIGTTDIGLCRLDSALPSSIRPALIPPMNFYEHMTYTLNRPDWSTANPASNEIWSPLFPVFRMDQQREIGVMLFGAGPFIVSGGGTSGAHRIVSDRWWDTFTDPRAIGGDSGCPIFWPFRGRVLLVLQAHNLFGEDSSLDIYTLSGGSISNRLTEVQDFTGPLEILDMTEFENYYA